MKTNIILAVAFTLTASAVSAQSLAAVAEKAAEDSKTVTAPSKVYTDKDVKTAEDHPSPSGKSSSPDDSTPKATTKEPSKTPVVKDEAWWRARMGGLRARLSDDQNACIPKEKAVARLVNMLDGVPSTAPAIVAGGYMAAAASIASQLVTAKKDLEECQVKVKEDKKALADAEEDGRVHSVLPGWLR